MTVCAACGEENSESAKFCSECGARLGAPAAQQEERKVVTVLFADLVGFTSRSEAMDVEDVRGTLQPYHQLLRRELERYGGTVEKFIGDAVMALFGAPVAHEDDPERAVRAALAIQDAVERVGQDDERLGLHIRIGVNTGEALIALGARASEGEGMASGDVVNAAARLQTAAPVDGVLVGEVTYRATRRVIEYEEAEPIYAKGKSEPLPVWVATRARSSVGSDVHQAPSTPLIGRERQLELLWSAFEQTREERAAHLVTVIGVPGIGKSRLVWELFRRVDEDPELIVWRQGRSLPYGDGVAFWAMGEIVKAQAGVLDSDSAETSAEKIRRSVSDLIADDRDAAWVGGHLRPLLGLDAGVDLSGDRRSEAFAAWRRFIEALAEQEPTVLVFEDLHWADEALLDFIDQLVEWTSGVPLLVVGTARPELLEQRSGWGGGKPNALTVALSPLSDAETAHLVAALLTQAVLPADTQTVLLERAQGNPLYAEEYVRMLIDHGVLMRDGRYWRVREPEQAPLPESVQGIIAARLDALSSDEKALLQAAAVIGKVFWPGAAEAVGGSSRWQSEELLHRLERKEFVRRERQSAVEGETEYAFRHILVRDVAYGQIPRGERADQHRRAAEWIESLSGDREDRSDMLCHHYLAALEFLRASGQESPALAARAGRALRAAGDRAITLNAFSAAVRFYEQALGLMAAGDPQRRRVLFGLGKARFESESGVPDALQEAIDLLLAAGELESAAEAEAMIGVRLANAEQRTAEAVEYINRAVILLQDRPVSREKAYALSTLACAELLAHSNVDRCIALSREALQTAEALDEYDVREVKAGAHHWLAQGLAVIGDVTTMDHIDESLRLASDAHSENALMVLANSVVMLNEMGNLGRARDVRETVKQRAFELNAPMFLEFMLPTNEADDAYEHGRWDEALALIAAVLAKHTTGLGLSHLYALRGLIESARGGIEESREAVSQSLALARSTGFPEGVHTALVAATRVELTGGTHAVANRTLDELLGRLQTEIASPPLLVPLALCLVELGRDDELRHVARETRRETPWLGGALALAEQDFASAAEIIASLQCLPSEALTRLNAGRRLVKKGCHRDGEKEIEKSLRFWRQVGASAYIREAEGLLAGAASA